MNINIYIENEIGKQITHCAEVAGKSRNAIIREALKEWLRRHQASEWPPSIQKFKGVRELDAFESHRDELKSPKEDPFA
jgi:hypothetical protein